MSDTTTAAQDDQVLAANIEFGPKVLLPPEFAANETKGPGVWVQLSPFGKFKNTMGTQIVLPEDAQAVVDDYRSFANTAKRVTGLPWYVGHPDHPDFKEFYNDTAAKGRIKDLSCRCSDGCEACNNFVNEVDGARPCPEHGLFALTKFNEDGRALIANESFDGHSVNWKLQRRADGWHPVHLKSVGFTNEPNIPVPPILAANEKGKTMADGNPNNKDPMATAASKQPTLLSRIHSLLKTSGSSLQDGANEDEVYGAMERMTSDYGATKAAHSDLTAKHATLTKAHNEMCNAMSSIAKRFAANEKVEEVTTKADAIAADLKTAGLELPAEGQFTFLANEVKTRGTKLTTETKRADDAVAEMANERKAAAKNMGDMLITGGFISKADHDAMVKDKDFATKTDFDAYMANAIKLKPTLRVVSGVSVAGKTPDATAETNLQGQLVDMANEIRDQRAAKGQKSDWDTCWGLACRSDKGKEIVARMKKPATA